MARRNLIATGALGRCAQRERTVAKGLAGDGEAIAIAPRPATGARPGGAS